MCRGLAQPFFLILLTRVPCPCLLVFGEIGPAFAKNAQGRGFSAGAHVGTIPARSLFRAVHSDSISNLLGRMWNPQRLAPILRRDVSRVEPAKARDQRSRDRGDRRPLSQVARLLSSAEEAQYAQPKRYWAGQHASNSHHSAACTIP